MKIGLVSGCVSGLLFVATALMAQEPISKKSEHAAPPALGIHWAKGAVQPQAFSRRSPNMTNHGGPIVVSSEVQAIFWGTSWNPNTYTGDKITGMDKWYSGFGSSNYAGTSDEYSSSNGQVSSALAYDGHWVDTGTAGSGANTSTILNEVCKVAAANGGAKDNVYYPVYVDLPRGNAGYCAYHSYGTCNGHPITFGFFWKLDGDAGCDPQSGVSGESQGLQAIANVSGHELSEERTDPNANAWYDSSGNENGDKCAWTFNTPYVTFKNGSQWKIQGEWSNNAYNSGTGYPNSSGQRGCLQGQ